MQLINTVELYAIAGFTDVELCASEGIAKTEH
jgi:hypothetical protein